MRDNTKTSLKNAINGVPSSLVHDTTPPRSLFRLSKSAIKYQRMLGRED